MTALPWLEPVQRHLDQALEQQRLGHAPLIHGPAGMGKLDLAQWLAARMLCLAPAAGGACGTCRACELLAHEAHPDLFIVDILEDRKEILVDSVRELIDRMQLTPRVGRHRVGMIVIAEALNRNAANALLKTLEEPADNAWLILRSHRPDALPATIVSRCQRIALLPPAPDTALEWLAGQCDEQPADERSLALDLAGGAPLAARDLLAGDELSLGLSILDRLLNSEAGGALVGEDDPWLEDPARTWRWLARWTRALMAASRGVTVDAVERRRRLPDGLDPAGLGRLWDQALAGERLAAASAIRQDLLLGKWLLEWRQLQARSLTGA